MVINYSALPNELRMRIGIHRVVDKSRRIFVKKIRGDYKIRVICEPVGSDAYNKMEKTVINEGWSMVIGG